MKPFLYNVAETFYREEGGDLSHIAFVFPNRRSGKFFQHYLAQIDKKRSMFSPVILTINSLMSELSHYEPVDKIELLFVIYEEYCKLYNGSESFDKFAFWGEMLAGDFDDVDKYMVDAAKLFANIKDLKDLDQLYLEPEQIAVIKQFWDTFVVMSDDNTKKAQFNSLWSILHNLYCQVRSRLATEGKGYEGMIFRKVAEAAHNNTLPSLAALRSTRHCRKIVFVGFNAFTTAERELLLHYKRSGEGDFYWDYFAPTLCSGDENRANYFIKKNTADFPSKYTLYDEDIITSAPQINVLPISSGVGQVKQAGEILQNLIDSQKLPCSNAINTAIVLPDEELLMPMVYSIPSDINDINITMGYPLKNTSVASFIDAISKLQRRVRWSSGKALYYYMEVNAVLNHRIAMQCVGRTEVDKIKSEMNKKNMAYVTADFLSRDRHKLLQLIFRSVVDAEAGRYMEDILEYLLEQSYDEQAADQPETVALGISNIEHEYAYNYLNMVSRLNDVIKLHPQVNMNANTYFALMDKLSASVPFVGEPLSGLQIMGVLETRALDFENVIILSMNEGMFPKKRVAASFIPYNLRQGFNMATTEHQDSIYAYYFYRLIGRASNVYLLYDSRTEGLKRGEMSRYIYQLKYHYASLLPQYKVNEYAIAHSVQIEKPITLTVEKSGEVLKQLNRFLKGCSDNQRPLSASSLKTYLNCPLQFYLQNIEGMGDDDEINEAVDGGVFGEIYHNVMGEIYGELCKRHGQPSSVNIEGKCVNVTREMLENVLQDTNYLNELIAKEFDVVFFKNEGSDKAPKLEGRNIIIAETVLKYVKRTLEYDRDVYAPFIYHASELKLKNLSLPLKNGKEVLFKAFIDRVDYHVDHLRIVDYKTGSDDVNVSSFDALFDTESEKHYGAVLQVLLYCKLYRISRPDDSSKLLPIIYKLKTAFSDFVPFIKIGNDVVKDYEEVMDEYEERLNNLLEEIFNEDIPFTQTQILKNCKYCKFKTICKRESQGDY